MVNEVIEDEIYKGEHQDEDLSLLSDNAIWEHLKTKIYDSSLTIVLISPNMKIPNTKQRDQWIPWEISYSLRETTRNDRTSQRNSILAVILPDKNGAYDYYDKEKLFPILKDNIDNGYIHVTKWDFFVNYSALSINQAEINKKKTNPDKIKVNL